MQKVLVSKAELFRILGPAALTFAAFLATDPVEGAAVKVMFENVEEFDLNDSLVNTYLIPLLISKNVLTLSDVNRITQYVQDTLGI